MTPSFRQPARRGLGLRRCAALLATLGLAFGFLLASAAGAAAAESGHIDLAQAENGRLKVVFSASGLPANVRMLPSSVALTLDGKPVPATATDLDATQSSVSRTVVLVMDVSGSVEDLLSEEIRGANLFIRSAPADVLIGLVSFSNKPTVLVRPTSDRVRLAAALAKLRPIDETALYDGVLEGIKVSAGSDTRRIVVFTDGADTRSSRSLKDAVSAITRSGVKVDAVSFAENDRHTAAMRALTRAGGGQLYTTNQVRALADAFDEAAKSLSNQIVVTASLPADLASRQATLGLTVRAGSATLTDSSLVALPVRPAPAARGAAGSGPQPVAAGRGYDFAGRATLPLAVGGAALGLTGILGVTLVAALGGEDRGASVRRRLSIYTLAGRQPVKEHERTMLGDSGVARSAMQLADRVVRQRDFDTVLSGRLEAAAVPLRPAEWLMVHLGVTIGVSLLLLFATSGRLLPALVGLVLGLTLPWVYLSVKAARRKRLFLAQMPETLQLMAGSLAAGYSLPQATDTVAREAADPVRSEFNRALVEARLGVPVEDALEAVATRMRSRDFAWVVMAVRIQRQVGGNLAELMTTVAATLRERERLRRQVRALSAEGRLSAWILGLLPPAFGLYLIFAQPDYLKPLYTDVLGIGLLSLAVLFLAIGAFWLAKVVKVEV